MYLPWWFADQLDTTMNIKATDVLTLMAKQFPDDAEALVKAFFPPEDQVSVRD